MQHLANRIYREFAFADQPVEIHALDGNGDMFQVYNGPINDLSAYNFVHVLRDPGCFYFFTIAYSPSQTPESIDTSSIIRRDLCWLTDPLAPVLVNSSDRTLAIAWDQVRFCGIDYPNVIDSVSYSLEIADGVEWKEGMLSRYINDMTALHYREVCNFKYETYFEITGLLPARFYHVRLVIHYLGFRVISEAATVHTMKATPNPPREPRIQVIPVKNSFDPTTNKPARLEILITWTPSASNGSSIQKYQVHLKRFDQEGGLILSDPPTIRKKPLPHINPDKAIAGLVKHNRKANQWTQSKGKSLLQIQNSIHLRSPGKTSPGRVSSPEAFGFSPPSSPKGRNLSSSSESSWKIIYDNLNRSVKMSAPPPSDGMWWIRIRAKNALGWSEFCPVVVLSRTSHPSLFQGTPPNMPSTAKPSSRDEEAFNSFLQHQQSVEMPAEEAEEIAPPDLSMKFSSDQEDADDSLTKFEETLRDSSYLHSRHPPPPSPVLSLFQKSSNTNSQDFLTQPNLIWNRPAILTPQQGGGNTSRSNARVNNQHAGFDGHDQIRSSSLPPIK